MEPISVCQSFCCQLQTQQACAEQGRAHKDGTNLPTSIRLATPSLRALCSLACNVQSGMQRTGPVLHFEMWMEHGRAGDGKLTGMGCGS